MLSARRKPVPTKDRSEYGGIVAGLAGEVMDRIEDIASSMARSAGVGAARRIERRLGEHPWTVALAAVAVAGVVGFLLGSRRHNRY